MKNHLLYLLLFVFAFSTLSAQNNFEYSLQLLPREVAGLPGIHSFAFAQHENKWLIVGGRKDGMHGRTPFTSFPASENNTMLYVIDLDVNAFWSASLTGLPTSIQEQLQSTNMNFYQDNDTLYIIGGYAFSASANTHKTFPNLTTIQVSAVIDAIVFSNPIASFFKQISDDIFAITGGQLGKIGETFYLVGGQRFEGRYNPMGGPSYVQTYSNQIRKFNISNSGNQLSYSNLEVITDPVHLRRRDYNLLPQIFPNGEQGYTISSGVFQMTLDLPFLYPVDITAQGITPKTEFNQYLSNYHGAKSCLYDSSQNIMHTLFFGGISQYFYQNGSMIQDNDVPFVKTISLLTREADGTLEEKQLLTEMPAFLGASAEFIINEALPNYSSEIIKLSNIEEDTITIGHVFGGILSNSMHPFVNNQTASTSASPLLYEVRLIKNTPTAVQAINGLNPYNFTVFPNPADGFLNLKYDLKSSTPVEYIITNKSGQIINQGEFDQQTIGQNQEQIILSKELKGTAIQVTLVFEHAFFVTKQILVK